jgi:exonuclease III
MYIGMHVHTHININKIKISVNIKSQINFNTVLVDDFNILLSPLDRSSRPKKKKNSQIYNIIYKTDITDIYRILNPSTEKYTYFSGASGTFPKTHHLWEMQSTSQ